MTAVSQMTAFPGNCAEPGQPKVDLPLTRRMNLSSRSELCGTPQKDGSESMKRVLVYCRVSSELQAEGGLSLAEQAQRMKAYALRNGMRIEEQFQDRGCASHDDCLPALKRMVEIAKETPEIYGILVRDLSRVARCSYSCKQIIEDLKTAGVRLMSVE